MRLYRLIRAAGFTVLGGMAVALTLLCSVEAYAHHLLFTLLKGLLLIGIVISLVREAGVLAAGSDSPAFAKKDLLTLLSVMFGAGAAFFVSIELGHGGVIGSAIVGLVTVIVLPAYAIPAFCGSFVGMASQAVFSSYVQVLLAGFIAGTLFVTVQGTAAGYGGKLGTVAFAGSAAAALLLGTPLESLAVPPWDMNLLIILYAALGAVLTYGLHICLGKDAVTASSLVGLLAGLVLPVLYGEGTGTTLAVIVFCASFAGMSSTERVSSWQKILIIGITAGMLFIFSLPYLGGAGGKLGTIAFASVLAVDGLDTAAGKLKRRDR